eukprot:Polyplicarium_translucidae@DN2923_c1_g1_i2.p1
MPAMWKITTRVNGTLLGAAIAVQSPLMCAKCAASFRGTIYVVGSLYDSVTAYIGKDPLSCPHCIGRRTRLHFLRAALMNGFAFVVVTPGTRRWNQEEADSVIAAFKAAERRVPDGPRHLWGLSLGVGLIPSILTRLPVGHFSSVVLHLFVPSLEHSLESVLDRAGSVLFFTAVADHRSTSQAEDAARTAKMKKTPYATVQTAPRLVSRYSLRSVMWDAIRLCDDGTRTEPLPSDIVNLLEDEVLATAIQSSRLATPDGSPNVFAVLDHVDPPPWALELMERLEILSSARDCIFRTGRFYSALESFGHQTGNYHALSLEMVEAALRVMQCLTDDPSRCNGVTVSSVSV